MLFCVVTLGKMNFLETLKGFVTSDSAKEPEHSHTTGDSPGEGYTCVPLRSDLVPAWSGLTGRVAEVEESVEKRYEETLAESLDAPTLDLEKDTWAVFAGDDLVAVGLISVEETPDPDGLSHLDLQFLIDPAHYDPIGPWLLPTMEKRVIELADERGITGPRCLQTFGVGVNSPQAALLARHGYGQVRLFDKMKLSLDALPDDFQPRPRTDAIVVRKVQESDQEAAREAHIDAFRDHWGEAPPTAEIWDEDWHSISASPEYSVVAVDPDGRVLAYCLALQTVPREVYLALVGVRREGRRRGLAPAVLTTAIRAAADSGDIDSITLHVDTTSPTGADGLYRKLGFDNGVVTSVMRKDA